MSRSNHLVIDKLVGRTQMAGQALLAALDEVARGIHAAPLDQLFVRPIGGIGVPPQPFGSWTMAGFAAHAVIQIEALCALVGRHRQRMTG